MSFYQILLEDYSTPAFTTFSKPYYGMVSHIDLFFQALERDPKTAQQQASLLAAYQRVLDGDPVVYHTVAYQEVPFLVSAALLKEKRLALTDLAWVHTNTWGHPYEMKCDRADSHHVWLNCQGKYIRCVQVEFHNLMYRGHNLQWLPLDHAWGFPHQLEFPHNRVVSRLFVEEKTFPTKSAALQDWEAFRMAPDPLFQKVLDDLFADG